MQIWSDVIHPLQQMHHSVFMGAHSGIGRKVAFTPRSWRMLITNISICEYLKIHVLFLISTFDPLKPNWVVWSCSPLLFFTGLNYSSPSFATSASAAVLWIHQQKLFRLPVSVLRASPISLVRLTTDSPYLFLQLCCKNKITKPIKLCTAQLNTSQLCC